MVEGLRAAIAQRIPNPANVRIPALVGQFPHLRLLRAEPAPGLSLFANYAVVAEDDPFRPMVIFDATRFGGTRPDVEALNLTFRHGTVPRAHGFAVLRVSGEDARAEMVTVEEPLEDRGPAGAPVLRRARLPDIDGEPLFPLQSDILAAEGDRG